MAVVAAPDVGTQELLIWAEQRERFGARRRDSI
jgi:hypothetical protein